MPEYELNFDDFNLDLLLDFQNKKIIESSNFRTVTEICAETLKYSRMAAIIGEPGYGKSIAFEYFQSNNKNIYRITVKKSMTSKDFYNKILAIAGWSNIYQSSTLYNIIESIGYYFNQSTSKQLIIIDEAGKLSHRQLLYLHDLRDSVSKNTGIIIAGPKYFEKTLYALKKNDVEGIPELLRRVDVFIELEKPSNAEKRELFNQYGFKNTSLINALMKECVHLEDVYKSVQNFALIAIRIMNEKN